MHEDMTTPQAPATIDVFPGADAPADAAGGPPELVADVAPVSAGGRSRLPFGLAALAAGLGIVAVVGVAVAGPGGGGSSGAPQGVALLANASPSPAQNGQDGQGGQGGPGGPGGWMGPGGLRGGMMGAAGMMAEGRFGGPHGGVSVASISGSQLALRTDDGWTRTIDASGATITKGGAAATLADIAVGDQIAFAQTRNADGTYTVTKIEIVLPRVLGTVTATSASGLTIKAIDGSTVTVTVTSSTTYRVAGKQSAALGDIKVGDLVMASGTKASDGSIAATTVDAFTPGTGGPGRGGAWGGWDDGGHRGPNGANPSPSAVPGA